MRLVIVFAAVVVAVLAAPQKEGAQFTNEAIRQAQNTYLIPKDATIQKVILLGCDIEIYLNLFLGF